MLNDLIRAYQGRQSLLHNLSLLFWFLPRWKTRVETCRAFVSALFLCVSLAPTLAHAHELALIVSDYGPANTEFSDALRRALARSEWKIRIVVAAEAIDANLPTLRQTDLWISVGAGATRAAFDRPGPPTLATLITRQTYEQLVAEQRSGRPRASIGAIVLDQPASRQIRLARAVLPGKLRMALLAGPDTRGLQKRIEAAAGAQAYVVSTEEVSDDLDVVPGLSRLLAQSDFLLALPDSLVFGRNNVRPVLLTSYRYQKPILGFSSALVSAGALAAVYSTPSQIAQQAAEWVITYPAGGRGLPALQSPHYFAVTVNREVARSLALEIPEDTALQRQLEAGRQEP